MIDNFMTYNLDTDPYIEGKYYCYHCGNEIKGEIYGMETEDEVFCEACWNYLPHCIYCGEWRECNLFEENGDNICIDCLEKEGRLE